MPKLHLLCNAHLDPYWLWEWEEGAAEAISTFRTAADLCEEFDGFIFNHNEVILYKWVEQYEPELFARIQRLVREGKWHIIGGWYLQPDCNMPSGESFVRQALTGKLYFMEKFGVEPTTAINFDSFGHTRGLAQILKKSGYDSYLFMRGSCSLPDADFIWVGYDGSEIMGHRLLTDYCSLLGQARAKVEKFIQMVGGRDIALCPWGVGDHGGGPSRKDLHALAELSASSESPVIVHSTPEAYFAELSASGKELARHESDINPWAVGCYTSQVRLKQKHRLLENELYMVEKMAAAAAMQGLMEYPKTDIRQAVCDLMVCEFHDILPGSSIQACEEAALRLMDHGLEILARIKAQAFFALASGQPRAEDGRIVMFAYNPHPFPVSGVFECEFNLPSPRFEEQFTMPVVVQDGNPIPFQMEQTACSMPLDWRKHAVVQADLAPSAITRFECTYETILPERPMPAIEPEGNRIIIMTPDYEAVINCQTGLLDRYAVHGIELVRPGAFLPRVMQDDEDPWGMTAKEHRYRDTVGAFALMEPEKATRLSGLSGAPIPSVRIIEDGPARTVVESVLGYGDSALVLTYKLPKQGAEIEIHVRVHWNEKNRMLKLAIPVPWPDTQYMGQVAFGRDVLSHVDREVVAQKWVGAVSKAMGHALTCINDGSYGSDYVDREIRLTLLRAPAYSGHPIGERPITAQDRYTPRIDQGERVFRFWLQGGPVSERLEAIDREALAHNEKPFILSFYPSGLGKRPEAGILLSGGVVQLAAFKQAERNERQYVVRLFEPTGAPRSTVLSIPAIGVEREITLGGFEVKTFLLDLAEKTLVETDLLERPLAP